MNRQRFLELIRALAIDNGRQIEVTSCADGSWLPVRVGDGQFEVCVDGAWRPCAIGGPGCREWKFVGGIPGGAA